MKKIFPFSFKDLINIFSGDVITAIDVGTTKIVTIVAKVKDEDNFEVLGYGISKSRGLNRGSVVDMEELSASISQSVKEAEVNSDYKIRKAIIGISGDHLSSVTTKSSIDIAKFPRKITVEDRKHLESMVEQKLIGMERAIVHRVAYNYVIDNENLVRNPVGMLGANISANIHLVVGKIGAIDALLRSVEALGIQVSDVIFDAWASSIASLSYTEKRMGSINIDLGGSKTDIAVVKDNKLIYSAVIPVGGMHFTNDIASVLNLDFKSAEYLKKNLPSILSNAKGDALEIALDGEVKKISLSYLRSIVEARATEMIEMMLDSTAISKFVPFVNSVVLTGGSAKIFSFRNLIEKAMNLHTRVGMPIVDSELPEELKQESASTALGLLVFGIKKMKTKKNFSENRMTLISTFGRIKELFNTYLG